MDEWMGGWIHGVTDDGGWRRIHGGQNVDGCMDDTGTEEE